MNKTDIAAALQPLLTQRLHTLVGDDLGNGTPLADAVASVLAVDMAAGIPKIARRMVDAVAELTDALLLDVADAVRDAVGIRDSSHRSDLPFGSYIKSNVYPCVEVRRDKVVNGKKGPKTRIESTTLYPMRGLPGLHPYLTASHPDEPGHRLLREEIARALKALPPSDVPRPTFDDIAIEAKWKWRDNLVVPMRGGPGQTFRHQKGIVPAETMLDIDIALIAAEMLEKSRDILERKEQVDREYAALVENIQPVLDKAIEEGLPITFHGVKVDVSYNKLLVVPEFDVLGHDLRPARWEIPTWINTDHAQALKNQIGILRRRKRILDEAGQTGNRGRVDEITLNAIRTMHEDPAALLRQIATEHAVVIQGGRNGKRKDTVRLVWKDGRVESSFDLTDRASWNYGRLIVKNVELPESVRITLVGQPVSALVEHPLLAGDHTIRSITGSRGWLRVGLNVAWTQFDAETGETAGPCESPTKGRKAAKPKGDGKAANDARPRQGDLLEYLAA